MMLIVKRLSLGLGLILVASAILLATDFDWGTKRKPGVYRVALLQHASSPILDEGVEGTIDGLAENGFREGDKLVLQRYNAQGDVGTASTIARDILNGDNDMVITISTLSLQAVATPNQDRQMRHVFGLVADPFSAGVGIEKSNPAKHPPYLVGQGIFMPVEESFQLARQMNPDLKKVGVVWNPAESNSKAFTTSAEIVCKKMNIELLSSAADNSAAVLKATQAAISRGAEAIWVGGDVTVSLAIDSVIAAARSAGIPVFTITPGRPPDRGTLFDVGINFHECGKLTGKLAADILKGEDPAGIPIRDVLDLVPRRLVVNRLALQDLKGNWKLPEDIVKKADIVVDEQGVHENKKQRRGE